MNTPKACGACGGTGVDVGPGEVQPGLTVEARKLLEPITSAPEHLAMGESVVRIGVDPGLSGGTWGPSLVERLGPIWRNGCDKHQILGCAECMREVAGLPPTSTTAGMFVDPASQVFFMRELTHDCECKSCNGSGVCSDCQGTGLNGGRLITYAAPRICHLCGHAELHHAAAGSPTGAYCAQCGAVGGGHSFEAAIFLDGPPPSGLAASRSMPPWGGGDPQNAPEIGPSDMPEPLPNAGASASDGGPELVEDEKDGEKGR